MAVPKIGISIGDVNGIGLEVIIKTLSEQKILNYCTPVIYGSTKVVSYHKNIVAGHQLHVQTAGTAAEAQPGKINLVQTWLDDVDISLGTATEESGKFAYLSLEAAVNDLKSGDIQGLVTAPIHKHAMELANFTDIGHTEYLGRRFEGSDPLMIMVSDTLRVGLVTGHVPVGSVTSLLNKDRVIKKIEAMNRSLKVDFGIERPVIAVLGLNPHAGDDGLIGTEDEQIITPAIMECKKMGIMAMGPLPADGFFGSRTYQKVDGILAMYHDQGLIPFKALSFGTGVNFTAGLPVVRTSPDHGVAFDIAGKSEADPGSFRHALFLALDVIRQRAEHAEWHANPLVKSKGKFRPSEDDREED
ncbi:MAG: 4-hydroxythreonine-4-phosphate dehydrogenase PdxA [Saprospiraceae bacterium]|nr:4-hydroxythreonine-4-phosphate dehydrogenase PdxA [Saprospiraceae bacterium]